MSAGKLIPRQLAVASLYALLALLGTASRAEDHEVARSDHEIARRALAAGEILPLRTVLQRLERHHPGEVLEVELEQKDSRWIYEVKLLGRDGSVSKLLLDARDAALIEIKGRRAGRGNDSKQHNSEARP